MLLDLTIKVADSIEKLYLRVFKLFLKTILKLIRKFKNY